MNLPVIPPPFLSRTHRESLDHVLARISPDRTTHLLEDLIHLYSPTHDEHEIQDFLFHQLSRCGAPLIRQPVDRRGRFNLVARTGDAPIGLLLVGHVDTVHKWYQGDYGARTEQGYLRGLGSADMKGGCSAMVEAFCALLEVIPPSAPRSIGLALVVGEEEEGDGIQALLKELKPDVAVVGEPTGLRLCPAHFGYLEVLLTARGKRAHSAIPELGENAIEALMSVCGEVTRHFRHSHSERLRPPLVCNLRALQGGSFAFVVPEYSEALLDIHLPPGTPVQAVRAEMAEILAASQRPGSGITLDHRVKFQFDGYALDLASPELQFLTHASLLTGIPTSSDVFRSHSDANCLWAAGVLPVVIGPGDFASAHTREERISLKELHQASRLYTAMGLLFHFKQA